MLEETKQEIKHHLPNIKEKQIQNIKQFVEDAFLFNKKHNIFVRRSLDEVYEKDVLDCLPLIHEIKDAQKTLDLGSGGGFPGILIGILKPSLTNHLLEKNQKKCYFLNKTIDNLELKNTKVIKATLNDKNNLEPYDLITARAFSSTTNILKLTKNNLVKTGQYILLKGRMEKILEELESIDTNKYKYEIIKIDNNKNERHFLKIKINE
jgi:16S rRNA (guanine527-N7)-methyltransferase